MYNWREQLNRLATEFYYGVGDLSELLAWAEAANAEMGEAHPDIWDMYTSLDEEVATNLLLKIAKDINRFIPTTLEAESFAVIALQKGISLFLRKKLSVQDLCKLVSSLDSIYVVGCATKETGIYDKPPQSIYHNIKWLGELWNCCDWCDASWTHDNSEPLIAEAQRVLTMLVSLRRVGS